MIELIIKCKDEVAAYEIMTFAKLHKLVETVTVMKGKKIVPIAAKGFINQKAVARIVPEVKQRPTKKIIDKHI